jgi:hypothetical protein
MSEHGAIDNTFDESERKAHDRLTDSLSQFPRQVQPGDIVIDLVQGRPLYVSRVRADTAVEYFDDEDFDLTTYKVHPWLPIRPDDTIFECVFVPTKPQDIPADPADKTYDYPSGRLARIPIEHLYDSQTRPQFDRRVEFLSQLFDRVDPDSTVADPIVAHAVDAFDTEVVDAALAGTDIDGLGTADNDDD